MHILYWFFLLLGIVSLLYYCLIVIYAGIGASFSGFWVIVGGGSILLSLCVRYMMLKNIVPGVIWRILFLSTFLIGFGIFIWIESLLHRYARKHADQGMEYIIILGAQIKGTKISRTLMRRLETALTYLKDNPRTKIIVSGGRGTDELISEAEAMRKYLVGKGIDKARIQMEEKSTNTNENIRYSKKYIREHATIAIVTNGFHIYRSLKIARKQGLSNAQGLAAPTDRLLSISYYVRESIGVIKDYLQGNI